MYTRFFRVLVATGQFRDTFRVGVRKKNFPVERPANLVPLCLTSFKKGNKKPTVRSNGPNRGIKKRSKFLGGRRGGSAQPSNFLVG